MRRQTDSPLILVAFAAVMAVLVVALRNSVLSGVVVFVVLLVGFVAIRRIRPAGRMRS